MSKVKNMEFGYTNEIYKVENVKSRFCLVNTKGDVMDSSASTIVGSSLRKKAATTGKAVRGYVGKNGDKSYRLVDMQEYTDLLVRPMNTDIAETIVENPTEHEDVKKFIHEDGISLKPANLIMNELKWKYLLRSAVRARNIMMTGPAGSGKTMAAKALVEALKRPFYYFNLGATQDPRAALIGNTHFNKASGTYFSESAFVKAIKTPYAVILLDELSRAHPEASNILMTVLDQTQRYLRLDEQDNSPIVKVAEGVTFIATANIGSEYTATRVMDRALLDRFVTIEIDTLDKDKEFELLEMLYPDTNKEDLKAVAEIAAHTRDQIKGDAGKLTTAISTRISVEMAGLLYDGFDLLEAAEVAIFPFYSQDGGMDSERTYIKQLVQKYLRTDDNEKLFNEVTEDANADDDTITW
jgi:adenosyl cobinamide kinase/adenosyl cobinamide phosphate guanylyltransferase